MKWKSKCVETSTPHTFSCVCHAVAHTHLLNPSFQVLCLSLWIFNNKKYVITFLSFFFFLLFLDTLFYFSTHASNFYFNLLFYKKFFQYKYYAQILSWVTIERLYLLKNGPTKQLYVILKIYKNNFKFNRLVNFFLKKKYTWLTKMLGIC